MKIFTSRILSSVGEWTWCHTKSQLGQPNQTQVPRGELWTPGFQVLISMIWNSFQCLWKHDPLCLQSYRDWPRRCVVAGKRSSPFLFYFSDYCYLVSNCSIEQFDSTVNLPEAPFKSHSSDSWGSIYQGAEQPALKSPFPPCQWPSGIPVFQLSDWDFLLGWQV